MHAQYGANESPNFLGPVTTPTAAVSKTGGSTRLMSRFPRLQQGLDHDVTTGQRNVWLRAAERNAATAMHSPPNHCACLCPTARAAT